MRILGVDPGYERCGVAVIEKKESKEQLLYSDCVMTKASLPFTERLFYIGSELERIIADKKPQAFAIEKLYWGSNQKTAMMVSEARGAFLYIAAKASLPIFEYTPLQIKNAVAGDGKGDKKQVITMLHHLISIEKDIKYDDEYDAIAVALTCLASEKPL